MAKKDHGNKHEAGFVSRKQWRWAFATHQPWARKKAHETAGGPKARYRRLPASKHSGRIARAIRGRRRKGKK